MARAPSHTSCLQVCVEDGSLQEAFPLVSGGGPSEGRPLSASHQLILPCSQEKSTSVADGELYHFSVILHGRH